MARFPQHQLPLSRFTQKLQLLRQSAAGPGRGPHNKLPLSLLRQVYDIFAQCMNIDYYPYQVVAVSLTGASLKHKLGPSVGNVIDYVGDVLDYIAVGKSKGYAAAHPIAIITRPPVSINVIRVEWKSRRCSRMPGNWTRYDLFTHNQTLVDDHSEFTHYVTRIEVTSPRVDVYIAASYTMDWARHATYTWFSQCHRVAKCSSTAVDLCNSKIGMCT